MIDFADKPLAEQTIKYFPQEKSEELARQITVKDFNEIIFGGLPENLRKAISLSPEEVRELINTDVQERAEDRTTVILQIKAKNLVAAYISQAAAEELKRLDLTGYKLSEVDKTVLEAVQGQAEDRTRELIELEEEVQILKKWPGADAKDLVRQKRKLLYETNLLAGLAISTEHVSPEMYRFSNFHKGLMQATLKNSAGLVADRASGIYTRENAGTFAHLLGLNIAREKMLPALTPTNDYGVEVFTSGMGALGSVLESISQAWHPDTIMASGIYFELPVVAQNANTIKEVEPVGENFYFDIATKLKQGQKPLAVFAQPFSSGVDDMVVDTKRILEIIKNNDGNQPVFLVLDTTMHGVNINFWPQVNEITSAGKDFTLIEIQSLVKHGQLGLDAVPGGVALAYGTHPEIISTTIGSRATMMPEANAAVLFPFLGEVQSHRIERAGRNAEYLAKGLSESQKDNPLIDSVYYAPTADEAAKKVSSQYETKSPILFLKLNPVIPERTLVFWLSDLSGINYNFPESGIGTSYGFDGTRFENIPIGRDGGVSIRIAAGQESMLQVMALEKYLDYYLNKPELNEYVSRDLKSEIRQIVSPMEYQKEDFKYSFYFLPGMNRNSNSDKYLQNMENGRVLRYFSDQVRGRLLVKEFTDKPGLATRLEITQKEIEDLKGTFDKPEEINQIFTSWMITQPEYIGALRHKLAIRGKMPSEETTYQIARLVTDNKAVKIILGPIAKMSNQILADLKDKFEEKTGFKLPG